MSQIFAILVSGAAVSFLRCARDCFGSCPIYVGASECCGPRSFCGWVAEPPVNIPVAHFKTYVQTIREDEVRIECNMNAEPYLSLGSSLSTCALSALEISEDEEYNGELLKCDMVRRLQIGNASLEACQEAIAAWGKMFGITSKPTPLPTANPIVTTTTTGITSTSSVSTSTTGIPSSFTTFSIYSSSNSTDGSKDRKESFSTIHIIFIVSIIFCIFLNIALAVGLQKYRVTSHTNELDIASNDTWDEADPVTLSNPMYLSGEHLDPSYANANQAMYAEPLYDENTTDGARYLEPVSNARTGAADNMVYDNASDDHSNNSAC